MDIDYIRRTSIFAAYESAKILNSHLGKISHIKKKSDIDLVTEADLASEKRIIECIRERFPDHTIMAEESGLNTGDKEHCWVIDPLDGTTNFAHQLPLFSVSIAYFHEGQASVGTVLNPVTGEIFSAVRGEGATLNGNPIGVSETESMSESLLVTGFPYNFKEILPDLMTRFSDCLTVSQGVRRLGSAALDLCFVACGRFDGFWEQNLKPWDTAAGVLIAREAGATVTDFSGNPYKTDHPEILATNGKIHKSMLLLLTSKDSL